MDQRISLITLGYRDYRRAATSTRRWDGPTRWRPTTRSSSSRPAGWSSPSGTATKLAADSGVTDGGGWGGVTLAYLVGSPAEVDEVLAARAGGRRRPCRAPGGKTPWGGYSGIFVDPEGHPWEVAHNPGWTLRDDGTVSLSA